MREKVAQSVLSAVKTLGEDLDLPELQNADEDTRLFGAKSGVDSVALVTLIAEVEDRLAEDFDRPVILADERAMSLKSSPFRRVGTLIDYAETLLKEPV